MLIFLEQTNPQWVVWLQQVLYSVIGIIATYSITMLSAYLRAKAKNKQMQSAVDDFEASATRAVRFIEQTFVEASKKQNTWNKVRAGEAFQRAMQSAQKTISKEAWDYVQRHTGDAMSMLKQMIEEQVYLDKPVIFGESIEQETILDDQE